MYLSICIYIKIIIIIFFLMAMLAFIFVVCFDLDNAVIKVSTSICFSQNCWKSVTTSLSLSSRFFSTRYCYLNSLHFCCLFVFIMCLHLMFLLPLSVVLNIFLSKQCFCVCLYVMLSFEYLVFITYLNHVKFSHQYFLSCRVLALILKSSLSSSLLTSTVLLLLFLFI